jgi:hypothetical protein
LNCLGFECIIFRRDKYQTFEAVQFWSSDPREIERAKSTGLLVGKTEHEERPERPPDVSVHVILANRINMGSNPTPPELMDSL